MKIDTITAVRLANSGSNRQRAICVDYYVRKDGVVVWEKKVRFGRNKANRAGGLSFQIASLEQEYEAARMDTP